MLTWSPTGKRSRGHPVARWSDNLNKFFQQAHKQKLGVEEGNEFWMILADDREAWHNLETDYVNYVMGS